MNFAEIDTGVVLRVTKNTSQDFIDTLPNAADWVECPYGVSAGWLYDGVNFTDSDGNPPPVEPPPSINYRTLLTGPEWVEAFTQDEWQWLKTRRNDGTTAGDRLDQMMDAIRWTDSVNVAAKSMDPFYDWMLAQGIPGGQARIDELRQGVVV